MIKFCLLSWAVCMAALWQPSTAQTSTITSFDAFMSLALQKSLTIKSGSIQLKQAKQLKLAAIVGVFDPQGSSSFSFTNNTRLPVNLIPEEILGGTPGNFREVKFGVQYNTSANNYTEIKLLNMQGWQNFKLAKLSISSTEIGNKIALKSLYDNCAVVYYNIVTLNEQIASLNQHVETAEKLYAISLQKFNAGLLNKQSLNESLINIKNIQDQLKQADFLVKQQYLALKTLCDIPVEVDFVIQSSATNYSQNMEVFPNSLGQTNAALNEKMALSKYQQLRFAKAPVLSMFGSITSQQFNTRAKIIDRNLNWIPNSYIGLKLSVPIPSASTITQTAKAKFDVQLAKNEYEKVKVQSKITVSDLKLALEKAVSQAAIAKEIYLLRCENYQKNLTNFQEGILGFEATLKSFTDMISSQYNKTAAEKSIELQLTKIYINNKITE